MIRNELPHETYLEIAVGYANLKRDADALRVFEVAPDQPQIRYWQAYLLRDKSPVQSRKILEAAISLSPYLVFPFREESIPVFQVGRQPAARQWKNMYYLGLVYWGLGRTTEAMRLFSECGDKPALNAAAYTSRAYLEQRADPQKALADYQRAQIVGKDDWRNWYHLATYYGERGMDKQSLVLSMEASQNFPDQDLIKILLARSYLTNGRYEDCYSVLKDANILPFEGQRDVHSLYVQCQLAMAMQDMKKGLFSKAVERLESSRENIPERLGTGKPGNPDYRVQDSLTMLCYQKMSQPAKADEAWGKDPTTHPAGPAVLGVDERATGGVVSF